MGHVCIAAMLVDLRHLARNLRRSPASAGAAILTLSLTLGAGASIFAVVDAVLLTPPPFADPDALVTIGETPTDEPTAAPRAVSYRHLRGLARARRIAGGARSDGWDQPDADGARARPNGVSVNNVTPGFLTLLGVTPALGRAFDPDDVAQPVAILSHAFWRGKLAADPGVIGREIVLGGQAHTIVGVLPEPFVFELNPADVWRPLPVTPAQAARCGISAWASWLVSPGMSLRRRWQLRWTTSAGRRRRRRVPWRRPSPRR